MARSCPGSTGQIHLPAKPAPLPAQNITQLLPTASEPPAALLRQPFQFGKKRRFVQKKCGAFGGDLGLFLLLTQKSKMHQAGLGCMKASHAQEKGGQDLLCPNSHNILNKEGRVCRDHL